MPLRIPATPQQLPVCDAVLVFIGEGIIKNTTQAFNLFLGNCGNSLSRYNKRDVATNFPFYGGETSRDFAGLKAIWHHPKRLLNVTGVFWTAGLLIITRVVSSMNTFNEGMYKPLPKCASGTLDPTALSRSCIASTKREGMSRTPLQYLPPEEPTLLCTSWWRTSS